MTRLNRSPILILAVIMLLAACGSTASSANLAATAATVVKGEFAGDAGHLAGIGLSTNGRQVVAYLCNGGYQHITLALWSKGPVTGKGIDITNAHGGTAQLMSRLLRSGQPLVPVFTRRAAEQPSECLGK
jgi:hypothetical protein